MYFLEGDAVDILHHDILDLIVEAYVVDLDDIRMGEHGNGIRLVAETADNVLVLHMFVAKDFEPQRCARRSRRKLIDVCHAARRR
jgi:hypothetical protein